MLFGRDTYAALSQERMVLVPSDSLVLTLLHPDRPALTVKFPSREVPVTAHDVTYERERRLKENEDALASDRGAMTITGGTFGEGKRMAEIVAEARAALIPMTPARGTFPALSDLRSDVAGNIWIRSFPTGSRETVDWMVLSPQLSRIGRISMPRGLRILDIGEDEILALKKDEYERETIEIIPIVKDGSPVGATR